MGRGLGRNASWLSEPDEEILHCSTSLHHSGKNVSGIKDEDRDPGSSTRIRIQDQGPKSKTGIENQDQERKSRIVRLVDNLIRKAQRSVNISNNKIKVRSLMNHQSEILVCNMYSKELLTKCAFLLWPVKADNLKKEKIKVKSARGIISLRTKSMTSWSMCACVCVCVGKYRHSLDGQMAPDMRQDVWPLERGAVTELKLVWRRLGGCCSNVVSPFLAAFLLFRTICCCRLNTNWRRQVPVKKYLDCLLLTLQCLELKSTVQHYIAIEGGLFCRASCSEYLSHLRHSSPPTKKLNS